MIEFNAYVRKPRAPRIFVNDIGGIYRLDGGIVKVTFVEKFENPRYNSIEQISLIWPEANWFDHARTLHWITKEIIRGTFRGDTQQLRAN